MKTLTKSFRFDALDQLRGLVIVIMALDHIRDFYSPFAFQPEDLTQTNAALFLTRWITHFCAPTFVLLAGFSAYLYYKKVQSKAALRHFLFTRGLWLVIVEVVFINLFWKANFAPWIFLQVIWVIGVSMMLLSVFIYLPKKLLFILSAAMIVSHNAFDNINATSFDSAGWLWQVFHQQGWIAIGNQGAGIFVLYPLIPWIGVIAIGYTSASWFFDDNKLTSKRLFQVGLVATLAFIALRFTNVYGDASLWSLHNNGLLFTLFSFINTTKYPPSLLFLLMTLGPALMLLAWLNSRKFTMMKFFQVFGRVPFFFYFIHMPVIHLSSFIYLNYRYGMPLGWQVTGQTPQGTGFVPNLLDTYIAFFLLVTLLYFCCRWFVGIKQRHHHWWLKYW